MKKWMATKQLSAMSFLVSLMLATAVCTADASVQEVQVDPSQIMFTFFPVTLLQAFAGVTNEQAAKISAIEAKLAVDRGAAKDDQEQRRLKRKANSDIRSVLLPGQIDTLSRCALGLQILTNTFGHDRLTKVTLTPAEVSKIQPVLRSAYAQYMQINQERDQEVNALEAQPTPENSQSYDTIAQEREAKIKTMRASVKAGVEPVLTDTQRAVLDDSPAPASQHP